MCDFFVNIQKYFFGRVTFYVLEFLKPRHFNFTHFLHNFLLQLLVRFREFHFFHFGPFSFNN